MNTDKMKTMILSTAMQLANLHGFGRVTRNMIADRAEIATGSVSYHWKDMKKLERAMVERAIETRNLKVLGQAVAAKHPATKDVDAELKRDAMMAVAGL